MRAEHRFKARSGEATTYALRHCNRFGHAAGSALPRAEQPAPIVARFTWEPPAARGLPDQMVMGASPRVSVLGPARQSLLALALARLLRGRLGHPDAQRHAALLDDCEIEITAGHMHSALCFSGGDVTLTCEPGVRPAVSIATSVHALAAIAGPVELLRSLLSGEIRARGRLLPMWHLAGVIVPRPPADDSLQNMARWNRYARALRSAFVGLWSVLSIGLEKRVAPPGGVIIPLGPRRSKSRPTKHAS